MNRVAFVTTEYRTLEQSAPSVTGFENARVISLNTNLTLAGAQIRLAEELAAGVLTRVFEVQVQQILLPDDFTQAPPSFRIYSERLNLNGEDVYRVFEVSDVNLKTGVSTLKVRR